MRLAVIFLSVATVSLGCGDETMRDPHHSRSVDASVDHHPEPRGDASADGVSTSIEGERVTDASTDLAGPVDVATPPSLAPVRGVVQGCEPGDYVDRRAHDADRNLAWTHGFGQDPERCLVVRVGQGVRWRGSLSTHPLDAEGGDLPNPIALHREGVVQFERAGTFGYVCGAGHSGMQGAVHVAP